ncbi:MAG: type pilus biosis ATPase PilM [Candidatus Hydrogenedentota bacterium]
MLFTKPKKAIGLDIGSHSVKAVQMSRSHGRLFVDEVGYAVINREQMNADPVLAQATAVGDALASLAVKQSFLVGALPGQTVVIRYPRLAESARANLGAAVEKEAGQSIPYDLAEVFLDWTLLDDVDEGNQKQIRVLLVAAKNEVIDSRVQITEAAELKLSALSVDSLALADAAEACQMFKPGETVALLNIGLTSASIHFVKDGISNFIRDVSWGAREMVQAIAKERRVDFDKAQQILVDSATVQPPAPVVEEKPAPKVDITSDADPFGEMGGGSLLDPLDDEPMAKPSGPAESDIKSVVGVSLSRMVSEIRRSFDYYEHQLYENPVDRVILCGGVAKLPLIAKAIRDELGVEQVDVADPANSALGMGDPVAVQHLLDQPSQFMVAVGLAARGMAEL